MRYKVDDLISILEISMKIFQVTENNNYSKKTYEIIKILNEFKGKELEEIVSSSRKNNTKTIKFDYEVLYKAILKLRNKQKLDVVEESQFYTYIDKNKELTSIMCDDSDAWFCKLNNVKMEKYYVEDLKLIYHVLTGNVIKSKKKNEILNEIKTTIYQKKYYSDLDKKFIKQEDNDLNEKK